MSMSYRGAKTGALCALLMSLIGCQPESPPMNEQEAQRVKQFTAQMSPRCVGRYIVDMPKAFVLNERSWAEVDGVKISIAPLTRRLFDLTFASRKETLEKAILPGKNKNRPHLRAVLPIPNADAGAIFDRSASPSSGGRLSRTLELLSWRDGYRIDASIDATDTTFPEYANESIAKQLTTDVDERLADLLKVYSRLRGRALGEVPSQPGLCIANGFVAGPATDTEAVQTAFHLEGTPDVYFNLFTQTEVQESTSMLDRSGQMESKMAGAGAKTIRKGERKIHDRIYEEWLVRGPTVDRVPGHAFTLQGNEKDASADRPMLELKLYNGFRIPAAERTLEERAQMVELTKASLSEAEAAAIWDSVTATLRPWEVSR